VPYAYGKLGANAQAASQYEAAISAFKSEAQRLDTAITDVGSGHMLDDMMSAETDGKLGWFWQLKSLPDSPQSRYLYALLADNDFQEGLKNYRDLGNFSAVLKHWDENMDAFGAMIETRQRAFDQRLPVADTLLASDAPAALIGLRAGVDASLTAAETGNDAAALGDAKERGQWARIRALEAALAAAPAEATADDDGALRDKLQLIKGTLQWRLDEKFKERDYTLRGSLREIDQALNEVQNRWARVQRARGTAPGATAGFAERIAALNARLAGLRGDMQAARQDQDQFLSSLATQQLLAQKERLAAYEVQAQFSLADIYDRAASAPGAPAPAGAPTP
jgi:hypothetical protein